MRHAFWLLALLLAQPVYATSLRAALDKAWENSPQAQTFEASRAQSDAQVIAANSMLPGAPAFVLSHRGGPLRNNAGGLEWEAGIALPLWLPGQHDAQQR